MQSDNKEAYIQDRENEHIKVRFQEITQTFLFFLAALHGLWNVSSPTKDSTWCLSTKGANHWTTGEFPHLVSSALVPAKLSTSVCVLYRKNNIMKRDVLQKKHFPQHRRLTIMCINLLL